MILPQITIYVYSHIRGVRTDKPVCAYVLEDASGSRKAYRRTFSGQMTANRLAVAAVIAALDKVEQDMPDGLPCEVQLHTDSAYLYGILSNNWVSVWRREGWKNAKGLPVANGDLWKLLYRLMGRHAVGAELDSSSSTYLWLKGVMENVDNGGDPGCRKRKK